VGIVAVPSSLRRRKVNYVYYHSTGNKGKCPELYAREEVLEACFADLLKGLVFDDQVMDWIIDALHSEPCRRETI
jgi:hypothetical protein